MNREDPIPPPPQAPDEEPGRAPPAVIAEIAMLLRHADEPARAPESPTEAPETPE